MKTIIAVLSLAIGAGAGIGPALALDGPGRALLPSDTELQIAQDAVLTGGAGGSIERSFIPPYSGVVRVKWDVRSTDGTRVYTSAFVTHLSECVRLSAGTAFVTRVCNLRVAEGMPVTITASPDESGDTVSLRNVRLYYRVVDSTGEAVAYELPELR